MIFGSFCFNPVKYSQYSPNQNKEILQLYMRNMMICLLFCAATQLNHKVHVPYGWIIGGVGGGLVLIILSIIVCVFLRSSGCFAQARGNLAKDSDGKSSHKFQFLQKTSFCCGSGRYICGKSGDWNQTNGEPSNHQITIPKGCNIQGHIFPVFIAIRTMQQKEKKKKILCLTKL